MDEAEIGRRARGGLPTAAMLTFALAAVVATSTPNWAGESPSPQDAGAYYGAAVAVAELCPGGRLTEQGSGLAKQVDENARAAFQAAADKTLEAWRSMFACRDADPETGRPNAACRRGKLLNCRQAWIELGPEGTKMRGLIDFALDAPRDAQR